MHQLHEHQVNLNNINQDAKDSPPPSSPPSMVSSAPCTTEKVELPPIPPPSPLSLPQSPVQYQYIYRPKPPTTLHKFTPLSDLSLHRTEHAQKITQSNYLSRTVMVPRAGTSGWRMFVIGGAIDVQSTEAVREVVELKEKPVSGGDDKMEVLKM